MQTKKPSSLALEKKQRQLELQKARQRIYNEKRKSNIIRKENLKVKTIVQHSTRHTVKSRKEYNRIMKQKSRALMSSQKKTWEKKKYRERKALKAAEKRSLKTSTLATTKSTLATTKSKDYEPAASSTPFNNFKTEWNVTSSARKVLPSSPIKYAKIVHNLVYKVSPKKKKAMTDIFETSNSEK